MKRTVLVLGLVGLAACPAKTGDGDDYAPIPGGNGQSGGGTDNRPNDGGTDAETGDAGTPLSGRVCLLRDLRTFGQGKCETDEIDGLLVTLGNRSATTAKNGAFTIIAPAGGGLTWHVTGDGRTEKLDIVPSVIPYSADLTLPVVFQDDYQSLQQQNSVVGSGDQQGSLFLRVVKNGVVAKTVTATSSPTALRGALYDTGTSVTWTDNTVAGTGAFGMIWFANMQLPQAGGTTAVVTLLQSGNPTPKTATAPIENQSITFQTIELQ